MSEKIGLPIKMKK